MPDFRRKAVRERMTVRLDASGMLSEALGSDGRFGVFHFVLPSPPWTDQDLGDLPQPPSWQWSRGRLAELNLTWPHGDASFVLWSWRSLTGWKSDPPKE